MATKLTLVPEEAAASIAQRVKLIKSCEVYIKDVVGRYDGLKAFEAELAKHGVAKDVLDIIKKG